MLAADRVDSINRSIDRSTPLLKLLEKVHHRAYVSSHVAARGLLFRSLLRLDGLQARGRQLFGVEARLIDLPRDGNKSTSIVVITTNIPVCYAVLCTITVVD